MGVQGPGEPDPWDFIVVLGCVCRGVVRLVVVCSVGFKLILHSFCGCGVCERFRCDC